MRVLNILGAGLVGQTLGSLLRMQSFVIGGVCNRSLASTTRAVDVIGAGTPVVDLNDLPHGDVYLITTSDDAIEETCGRLAAATELRGTVVLHCSGSLPSSILHSASKAGAYVASVHPIKSFADVEASVASFAGTFCGIEGDDRAIAVLEPAFRSLGGELFRIDATQKTIYHAGIVFAMNYFVTLVDVGLRCYEKAGVPSELALRLLEPILTGVVGNVTRLGPAAALTGPIARGDVGVVERQLESLGEWQPQLRDLYAAIGAQAVSLSEQQGNASPVDLQRLRSLLGPASE